MPEPQASRKVHQRPLITTNEYQDNMDSILDLYNEGRATLDQVAKAINDLKADYNKGYTDAVQQEWDGDSAELNRPFDQERD